MKRINQLLIIGLLFADIAHAGNEIHCIKAKPYKIKTQVQELDCYSDYDVESLESTGERFTCFIKFAQNENITKDLNQNQQDAWVKQEMGKTILSTYANKLGQPQILMFKNGSGVNVQRLSKDGKYTSHELAQAIGISKPIFYENTIEGFNALKAALGSPAKDCKIKK